MIEMSKGVTECSANQDGGPTAKWGNEEDKSRV